MIPVEFYIKGLLLFFRSSSHSSHVIFMFSPLFPKCLNFEIRVQLCQNPIQQSPKTKKNDTYSSFHKILLPPPVSWCHSLEFLVQTIPKMNSETFKKPQLWYLIFIIQITQNSKMQPSQQNTEKHRGTLSLGKREGTKNVYNG